MQGLVYPVQSLGRVLNLALKEEVYVLRYHACSAVSVAINDFYVTTRTNSKENYNN